VHVWGGNRRGGERAVVRHIKPALFCIITLVYFAFAINR